MFKKIQKQGTSLVVQWLRLHASSAGGLDVIHGRGTEMPRAEGQLCLHTTAREHMQQQRSTCHNQDPTEPKINE